MVSSVEQRGDGGGAKLVTNSNVIHTGHDDYQGKPTNSGTSKQQSDGAVNVDEESDPANEKKDEEVTYIIALQGVFF